MCAIFGLIDYGNRFSAKSRQTILSVQSQECEARGTDATGFAFNTKHGLSIYKRPLPARTMRLKLPEEANVILGHTRMTTQGSEKFNPNNHPFKGKVSGMEFALAHNGVLHNDTELRERLKLPKTKIQTDSYIAVQLLENSGEITLNSVGKMAEKIDGSFVFTLLDDENNSYFVKGDNPLALYHYAKYGFYIYASTDAILRSALEELNILKFEHDEIKTSCGDILKIDSEGVFTRSTFDTSLLYDYYYGYPCNYFPRYTFEDHNSTFVRQLKEFANTMGVAPEDVDLLLDYGYDVDEIAEMLYEPCAVEHALGMIYEEIYGYGEM